MKSNKPIEACIVNVRGQKVILDADLAQLYEVPTKVFNQALKRHANRFPRDFLFELTLKEWSNLRSQFVTSSSNATQNIVDETNAKCMVGGSHGGRRTLPHALTEHGVIMAATLLNSQRAVSMSIFVVRAFIQMREQLAANASILARLAEIDRDLLGHDAALRAIWTKLQPLLAPPLVTPKPKIGFNRQ